jgi:phosphoribosylaminoimidazolecarboxamide formyltransferase/IMP cyclohydrolase
LQALISVYDKTGLDKISKVLNSLNYEIFSTGGTLKYIKSLGINAISISELTNFKEILGGRVKTLHPNIHAGILADLNNPDHLEDLREYNIAPFDIVINNLYPFEEVLSKSVWKENSKSKDEEIIENIDIGGPSMIRSASKNFESVTTICEKKYYEPLINELKTNNGKTTSTFRKRMAQQNFKLTSDYDLSIFKWFNKKNRKKINNKIKIKRKLYRKS